MANPRAHSAAGEASEMLGSVAAGLDGGAKQPPIPRPREPALQHPRPLIPRVAELRPGTDFVLAETLHRDPLGVTYRARDRVRDEETAVTLFHPSVGQGAGGLEHFQNALLASVVDHPAIIGVDRIGRWRSQLAIARRLIYAPTLSERYPRGQRCGLMHVLDSLRPIAQALDTAHGRGVSHGDLRLDSILVSQSSGALLLGCGLADALNLQQVLTSTLERRTEWAVPWLDTAGPYLAPERWRGVAPDSRSDQYALGVIAFRLLTGELPYSAEQPAKLAELHRVAIVPRPSSWQSELPPYVDRAIARALAKVAAERFTTATAFLDALAGRASLPRIEARSLEPPPLVEPDAVPAHVAERATGRLLDGWLPIATFLAALVVAASLVVALRAH